MKAEQIQDDTPAGTSGYVEGLDKEMDTATGLQMENDFGNLHEFYVSPGGHTRLFHASRYGKKYVLKCLKEDYLYIPLYRQALTKEFEIGLQLDHSHIARTINMEHTAALGPVIVMERIDGCTLKSLIEQRALTPALARKLAAQIAQAIDYMHSKQIIHRDLKPSNIMVTHNGHDAKLIDFSLADSDAFNVLKQPAGTSGYIAPEQLLPGAKADVRADIYSFGKVLKDMASATGDRRMLHAATICTRRNVAERPSDMAGLKDLEKRNRRLTHALVALSLLAALSGACAAWAWHHRRAQIPQEPQDTFLPDGNKAADYHSWPSAR